MVDGAVVGELRRGETKDVPVEPGRHVFRISVEGEQGREWDVSLAAGDVVVFVCRSRGKYCRGAVDVYLADPGDQRAQIRPPAEDVSRDMAQRQRVVSRGGDVLEVWAHRSGYFRSLDPGSSSTSGDAFFLELAYYVLVLPFLSVIRFVRHRLLFRRGWSVGVVRQRRFLWPKKVRIERFRTEVEARARAAQVLSELES